MSKFIVTPLAKVTLLLLTGLVAACSTVPRLAYNNSPALASWYVDDYFSLNETQRDTVRDRFERLLVWHRKSELPEIRALLAEVHDKVGPGMTAADTERAFRRARASYERTVLRALPDMAEFITSISPDQVVAVEKKLAEANSKLEKDIAKPTRAADRAKRIQDQFTDFVGAATPGQKIEIQAAVSRWPPIDQAWIADRKLRQQEMIKLLKSRPTRDEASAGIRRLMLEPATWRSTAYVEMMKQREQLSFELYAKLLASLTPEQQASLKKRLKGYEGDVMALMMAS